MLQQPLLLFHQLLHLFDEPFLYTCDFVQFFHGSAFFQGLIHGKMPLAGGSGQHPAQLLLRFLPKPGNLAQAISAGLQGADGFLEGFLVVLPDAHDLAHGTHLGAQPVLHALELLEGPAGEFDDHVVAIRYIFIQCTVFPAGDVL